MMQVVDQLKKVQKDLLVCLVFIIISCATSLIIVQDTKDIEYNSLGTQAFNDGDMQQAIVLYGKAINFNPDHEKAFLNIATVYERKQQYVGAISIYAQVLKKNPNCFYANFHLAIIYYKFEKLNASMQLLSKIIHSKPDFEDGYFFLGKIFAKKKNFKQAIKNFKALLALNPYDIKTKKELEAAILADSAQKQTDLKRISQLKEEVRKDPHDLKLNLEMARLYMATDDLNSAIKQYNQILTIDSDSIDALQGLAQSYTRIGDYDHAIIYLEKMVTLRPEANKVYYNLACLYAKQHNVTNAIDNLKKAISTGYNNMDMIRNDKDLENIKDTEFYKNLTK